jgi:hypothetical protein
MVVFAAWFRNRAEVRFRWKSGRVSYPLGKASAAATGVARVKVRLLLGDGAVRNPFLMPALEGSLLTLVDRCISAAINDINTREPPVTMTTSAAVMA